MTKQDKKSNRQSPPATEPEKAEETQNKMQKAAGDEESSEEKTVSEPGFPIVAVGASAGGLRAIEGFLRHLPESPGMAFIILQHLDPRRQSFLENLLSDYTELPVNLVEEGMAVEPDRIYIRPPDRQLSLRDGKFQLPELAGAAPFRLIDRFFTDLADDAGENAVCVILSGAGSDGAQGLRAINAGGGLVVVQEESQAEYPAMPQAALETGLADYVLPVERMGEKLVEFARQSRKVRRQMKNERTEAQIERDLGPVLQIVRKATGHDFSCYKRNTLRRRIERRMALHRFDQLRDYTAFLRQDGAEAHALFNDLLINVTSFFRDPDAFAALEKELFEWLRESRPEEPVRVWVPGCATGEEAYSIAILLVELMDRLDRQFAVKIFATDINLPSIQTARDGLYPESIAGELSEHRLKRFFHKSGSQYRISGQLRDMVIFSPHNVASDPPFSNLDLVSCRNLLIYMDQQLQKRVLPLLHYSLKQGGVLFLGTSEDVGEFTDLFTPANRKWKIFRSRQANTNRHHEIFSILGRTGGPYRREVRREETEAGEDRPRPVERRESMREVVERTIVEEYAPPGVLVDAGNRILYFHGDSGRYLTPPKGEAVFDLLKMARSDLGGELETLMEMARRKGRMVRKGARLYLDHHVRLVDLSAKRVQSGAAGDLFLITFREQEEDVPVEENDEADARVSALQRELYHTRQDLQATIEELETTNEELQSTNEELQANNEELQSTNEELETSREELQSTNEELETVNSELQRKNEELVQANDDMNNLFAATDLCTVILDHQLRIQRFTPAATRLFRLIDRDRGRPITDIVSALLYEEMTEDLEEVLRHLGQKHREVKTREGGWYSVRIQPYRTSHNQIAGVVLTLAEITRTKEMEMEARKGRILAESILETLREPLLVLEEDLRVVEANRAFYGFFQVQPNGTEKVKVYDLGNRQWDLPPLRRLLEEIIPKDTEIRDYRVEGEFPGIGRRNLLLNARRIDRGEGRSKLILLSFAEAAEVP